MSLNIISLESKCHQLFAETKQSIDQIINTNSQKYATSNIVYSLKEGTNEIFTFDASIYLSVSYSLKKPLP